MFDIEEDSEIFFYGYSQFDLVKDKYNSMLSEGYKVRGFIDKKAYEIRKIVPCWFMEEFIFDYKENKNVVIILLLQNGLQHEEIARSFIAEGYKKILFIPSGMNSEEKRKMYGIYNEFLEGAYRNLRNIPEGDDVLREEDVCRELARTREKWLTYFVPTELLFSYDDNQPYGNENIRLCIPYRELYDYLSGKCKTCFHYLEFMGKNANEEFLMDRHKLFLFYEYERNFGMDYFVETAAYVKWNDNGYFNIIDGHHRAAYLAYRGYVQIPVRMEKKDFPAWENKKEAAELKSLSDVSCPIPVPGLMNRKCSFEPRWMQVTDFFFGVMSVWKTKKIHFMEADMNFGFYARFLQRARNLKSNIVMWEKEHIEICQTINRMLRQDIEICEIPKIPDTGIQAAYIDIDFLKDDWFEMLLSYPDLLCLVFEVTEKNEKQYLDRIQNAMGSLAEYICHYQSKEMKKIYGIKRGEKTNGGDNTEKFEKESYNFA